MNENEIIEEFETNVDVDFSENFNGNKLVNTEEVLQSEVQSSNIENDLLLDILTLLRAEESEDLEDIEEVISLEEDIFSDELNFNQYIYDLLLDSSVKVEVMNDKPFLEKSLYEYSVSEGLLLIIALILFIRFFAEFVKNNVFKLK